MITRNRLSLLLAALCWAVLWAPHTAAARRELKQAKAKVFLQKQLPLSLVLTTPVEVSESEPEAVDVLGRQAITAVFSRPVIALGSDFGQPAAQQKFPFRLSCPVPGKQRWVTTTIARFDPDVDWPTDLDCTLSWANDLTSYDGAPLQLGDVPTSRRLVSGPLSMSVTNVLSGDAEELTDDLWAASISGEAPEVPPDGKVLLSFSYPVHLQTLKSALKLAEGFDGQGPAVELDISPCQSPAPWWLPKVLPAATSSSSGLSLDVNTSCAQVIPRSPLKPGTSYQLLLPQGARYHALAGPIRQQLSAALEGLRPFKLPFNTDLGRINYGGTSYRRLDVWLRHGLSADTTPQALAEQISLCELADDVNSCTSVPFTLSLVSRGKARLSVSTLKPDTQYRISVAANAAVKDGFGQGLQASSSKFWTSPVGYTFSSPVTRNLVAVLEAGSDPISDWPFVTRSPVLSIRMNYGQGSSASSADAWEVDLGNLATRNLVAKVLLQGYTYETDLRSLFGPPTRSVPVPNALRTAQRSRDAQWAQLLLPLRDASAPFRSRLISFCCTERGNSLSAKLLLNSSLSFNMITAGRSLTAWVLDAKPGGAPVAGASVHVYYTPIADGIIIPWGQAQPLLVGSCTTDADGVCTVTSNGQASYTSLVAFAIAGEEVAVLDNAGFLSSSVQPPPYVGSIVADRRVVVPGDKLKITGFVQAVSAGGLQLPASSYASLLVSPAWTGAEGSAASSASSDGVAVRPGRGLLGEGLTNEMAVLPEGEVVAPHPLVLEPGSVSIEGASLESISGRAFSGKVAGSSVSGSMTPSPSSGVQVVVQIDGTTGTFHGEIEVPQDARLQPYSVRLAVPNLGDASGNANGPTPSRETAESWPAPNGALFTFTVADPRPPTAELKLETTPWVLPTGVVVANVTAVSYVGASVDGSSVSLTWRTAKASGVVALVTDLSGFASATIDLGALPEANRTELYESVQINVEWIGPTRERVTKEASVTIAGGPARLDFQLSVVTDIPSIAFAVAATLTSNTDGSALPGLPVTATLRPLATETAGVTCAASATSCTLTSGAPMTASACQLSLPCVGHFELEACADVPSASGSTARVCSRRGLGHNATEWAQQPLVDHATLSIFADKSSYAAGETAILAFANPWPGARLLVQWGNIFTVKSKVFDTVPSGGLAQATLGPLGDECIGGCSVLAVLSVPRLAAGQAPALPPASELLVSQLFDPLAPHTHAMSLMLDVRPDNNLAVSVNVTAEEEAGSSSIRDADGEEVLAVEPGAEAQVTVSVKSGADVPPADSVEVTVYAVDKAFLDLLPYDLPKPQLEMVLSMAAGIALWDLDQNRVAPGAVKAVYEKLLARLTNLDPWLPVDVSVIPGNTAVDATDADYLARYSTALTFMPQRRYEAYNFGHVYEAALGMASDSATTMPMYGKQMDSSASSLTNGRNRGDGASGGAVSSTSGSGTVAVRREGDFVVTPLFATAKTGADGLATITFTAPQNLGTFVVRAFAAAGSAAKYGSAEAKVAVRRRVSLTPSVPRFVRVGDTFEAGVVVTVGSAPASIGVELEVDDEANSPLTLVGTSAKTATFAASGGLQKEVRFSFSAASVGTTRLTFTASDGQPGGAQDSVQLEIPVMGQQGDVWVATSFALTATPASDTSAVQWQEGMDLPAAVPGSGGLTLTAGVGYFPAIASMYDNLQQDQADSSYPLAQPSLLLATLPAVLSYYAQSPSADQAALVAKSFTDLGKLTDQLLGLLWSDPARWATWRPDRTDMYLNTWALFLAQSHNAAALQASPDTWANLRIWRSAVQRQLVLDAVEARNRPQYPGPYNDYFTLAWARLVLGADWTPVGYDVTDEIVGDLSLETLVNAAPNLGRETRVLVALLIQAQGAFNVPGAPKLVGDVITELTSALRVQGRTAYIAAGPGASSASSLGDQALSLLLLLRSGTTHQLLPKLAAYVANPVPVTAYPIFCMRPALTDQGLAVLALSEYDRVRGSSKPNVDLAADANGLVVLEASFRAGSGSLAPVTNTTGWEDIPAAPQGSPSELSFQATGSGEVSVSASLHFVPVALPSYPTYRGLYVESALQLVDPLSGQPTGRRLASVPLGSVVSYTVQLTTPDDLGAVTLSVMMPGGLEPLDPNVASGLGSSGCGAGWVDGNAWSHFFRWWWWPVCPAQETRPSVVTFSYLALRAGTSTVTIRAVAATAGTFVVPPVRASADLQPELMGMTGGSKITICASCAGPVYGSAPQPVVPCPNACSGNGICNLKTGRCTCDAGFSRSDCSRPVA